MLFRKKHFRRKVFFIPKSAFFGDCLSCAKGVGLCRRPKLFIWQIILSVPPGGILYALDFLDPLAAPQAEVAPNGLENLIGVQADIGPER